MKNNKKIMKRLCCFDFDGCLINSPKPEEGKKTWKEKTGKPYPHKEWWDKKESLNTNIFNIKPFPNMLAQLKKEKAIPNTKVIILTARIEKLRPEIENILNNNDIVVDDVILKRGNEDKGDVILKIENYNQDLKEIIVYDDFAGGKQSKINEYLKIKDLINSDIDYKINYVKNNKFSLLENKDKIMNLINEEIDKLNFFNKNINNSIYSKFE